MPGIPAPGGNLDELHHPERTPQLLDIPRFDERVALVTGGSRGIGRAISLGFAMQGATVATGYSSNKEAAEAFRGELSEHGSKPSIHQGNVGSAEDFRRVIDEVIAQANYAASKSGLFGLTYTLAKEAAFTLKRADKLGDPIGLTVNTVAPGFIATEMLATVPEKVLDRIKDSIPLGRLGEPDEVARVVRFLSSDNAGYSTGEVWGANGGVDM